MQSRLTIEEQRTIVGIADDIASILAKGFPSGYGYATEKMAHRDAEQGLVRPDGERWLGGPLDAAGRMRWLRMLARLERRGLIERISMGYDATRTTHVGLTDAGRTLAEQLRTEAATDAT